MILCPRSHHDCYLVTASKKYQYSFCFFLALTRIGIWINKRFALILSTFAQVAKAALTYSNRTVTTALKACRTRMHAWAPLQHHHHLHPLTSKQLRMFTEMRCSMTTDYIKTKNCFSPTSTKRLSKRGQPSFPQCTMNYWKLNSHQLQRT